MISRKRHKNEIAERDKQIDVLLEKMEEKDRLVGDQLSTIQIMKDRNSILSEKLDHLLGEKPTMITYEHILVPHDRSNFSRGEIETKGIDIIHDLIREAGKHLVTNFAQVSILRDPHDDTLNQMRIRLTIPEPRKFKYENPFPYQKGPFISESDLYNYPKQSEAVWNVANRTFI